MPNGTLNVIRRYRGDTDRQLEALLLLLQEGRVSESTKKPAGETTGAEEKGDGFEATKEYHTN